jgi:ferredoxin
MSVSVTFEPSGINGLVAQGTYLIDAAKRMGAPLGQGCLSGKSECPACVVSVKNGVELLSAPTAIEEKLLGLGEPGERLRMLCQAKIEGHGEIVLMVSSFRPKESQSSSEVAAEIEKKFAELSLKQKIAALVKFEAITMTEALDAAMEKPLAAGTKVFDSIMARAKASKSESKVKP